MSDQRKAAIEAMARAIWADRYPEVRWDDGPSRINLLFIGHATAALDALLGVLPALGLTFPMPVEADMGMVSQALNYPARLMKDDDTMYHGIFRAMIAAAPNVLGGSDGE